MKVFVKRVNRMFIKWALPWIATVVTALPYSDKKSRLLDRLTVLAGE